MAFLLKETHSGAATYVPSHVTPPRVMREYRAAWVATVANLDWPSTNALLSVAQQKAELVAIMERATQLKLNALIFQVRPCCDAMYASSIEPWSEYLTGTMGRAPEPFYDPLALAVEEAHKRGLELHAWFNPYRAHHPGGKSPIAPTHISRTHPELVRHYGKSIWLDPGEKAVQDYSLSVVMDVVKRYDIDGVHFDDYFYPYKEQDYSGRDLDFPDDASWQQYGAGSKLSRDDWRRDNVNQFIHRVYESIKAAKPWVKFGISPFGIWRPGNPAQIQGFDAYAQLYADSRKWLAAGWVDYFAPQLYWAIEPPQQSFPVLLKWWAQQNPKDRLLLAGMDATKTNRRWKPEELINQIYITRKEPGTSGHVHWDMRTLMRNGEIDAELERAVYQEPALPPPCPWLHSSGPAKPQVTLPDPKGSFEFDWAPGDAPGGQHPTAIWLLQTRTGKSWSALVIPGRKTSHLFEHSEPDVIAVTAVDRFGNASRPTVVELKRE